VDLHEVETVNEHPPIEPSETGVAANGVPLDHGYDWGERIKLKNSGAST